jgi:hypothetical protein
MKKVFALCGLFLCSCGFTPMYSDALTTQTKDVWVAPISGTNGIDLRNLLRAKLGDNSEESTAKYSLKVDLKTPYTNFKGLQKTGDATWQEVRVIAKYSLKENSSGKILISSSEVASESYTFVRDLVAAKSSQTNAEQNTIRLLSDKISMRVSAAVAK